MKQKIALICLLFNIFHLFGQTEKKENLLTIGADEIIITSESRFVLSCNSKTSCVLTKDNNKQIYYVYQNGTKTGPFTVLSEAYSKCPISEATNEEGGSIYASSQVANTADYLFFDNNLTTIKFGGKNYGPFKQILGMYVSEDKQKFYAVIRTTDLSQMLISNTGKDIKIEGNISSMKISPKGNSFMVTSISGIDMASELLKLNDLKLSSEEYQKRVNKLMEEVLTQTNPPSISIYLNNGTTFGPYLKEIVRSDDAQFCKTGGDNWMIIVENKLLINGKEVLDFKDNWVSINNIWISEDGNRYAYKTYDKLIFSDGKSYDYPLVLEFCKKENELVWIILEHNSSFVKYSRKL
jgi:hypothetical protein